jgi:hypothetical protein
MKISFNFDSDSRSVILTPTNDLEKMVLEEMGKRAESGQTLSFRKIIHEYEGVPECFIVEMKVNGR